MQSELFQANEEQGQSITHESNSEQLGSKHEFKSEGGEKEENETAGAGPFGSKGVFSI